MRRGRAALAAMFLLAAGFSLRPAPAAAPVGRWVSGDLHVRTTYSGDSCRVTTSGPKCDDDGNVVEASPANIGVSAIDRVKDAEQRGLSFIAITDLDNPSATTPNNAQNDVDIAAYKACHDATPATCPVLILDGVEKPLTSHPGNVPAGNALAVGYTGPFPADPTPSTGWTTTDFTNTTNGGLKKIHDAGGILLAEGAGNPHWKFDLAAIPVDGYDVWRGSYLDQSEFTGAAAADNPQAEARWRTGVSAVAALGKRLTAFGGSGADRAATGSVSGPGQPTIWVYDIDDAPTAPVSWPAIRQAILAGRVIISFAPPSQGSPQLRLEGLDTTDALAYIAGDSVPNGSRKIRMAWSNAPPGAMIRILGVSTANGTVLERTRATIQSSTGTGANILVPFVKGAWYRAEMFFEDATWGMAPAPGRDTLGCAGSTCFKDRYAMLALSGTLYGT